MYGTLEAGQSTGSFTLEHFYGNGDTLEFGESSDFAQAIGSNSYSYDHQELDYTFQANSNCSGSSGASPFANSDQQIEFDATTNFYLDLAGQTEQAGGSTQADTYIQLLYRPLESNVDLTSLFIIGEGGGIPAGTNENGEYSAELTPGEYYVTVASSIPTDPFPSGGGTASGQANGTLHVTAVPEASAWALILAGMSLAMLMGYRSRLA